MTHLSADEIKHLEHLIAVLTSRIQLREIQIAQYGSLNADPHIVTDKQEAEQQLIETRAKLRRLQPETDRILRPYVGLATFQEEDARFFFGREKLIGELVQKMEDRPFLAVLGPSGSGKSSVVRAGLIPALKNGILPGSQDWRYVTMRPTKAPLKALEKALYKIIDATKGAEALTLAEPYDNTLLLRVANRLFAKQNDGRLVLIVDQAEELWTALPLDPLVRKTFIEQQQLPFLNILLTAIQPGSRVIIVLTMRADFLHRTAEHHQLAQAISSQNVIISPLRREELQAAIARPAEAVGCCFEQGLVDELIEETLNQPGALPLLEYTLQELWVDRRSDGTLTWTEFRTLGGVAGALGRRADNILEERYPSIEQHDELRAILLSLIQPGEGIADTKRRLTLRDLSATGKSVEIVQAFLKPLVDERLVTIGLDQASGEEMVEISHEALIRAWPTLNEWINEHRNDLRFQIQLEEAAKEWAASGESADFLWSGLRLANAVAWKQRSRSRLNERVAGFLDASLEAEHRRIAVEEIARREREQLLEARASAALQAQLAAEREAQARALAEAQARAGEALFDLSRGNTDRALLLARAAVTSSDDDMTPLVCRALRRVFEDTLPNRSLYGHVENINKAVWSPDGREILTGSDDKTARIWDAASGRQLHMFEGKARIISVAWGPTKQYILAGFIDGTVNVWEVQTGALIQRLSGHKRWVTAVSYSPDGEYILTGAEKGRILIYRAVDFMLVRELRGHVGLAGLVFWSPDGRHILARNFENSVCVWDVQDEIAEARLQGHTHPIRAMAWSPDGCYVLTGSADRTARIWDAVSGTTLQVLQGHTNEVWAVAWSPDGHYVLTGSTDHTARIWDAVSGTTLQVLQGHTSEVWAVAWSPDSRYVLTSSNDNSFCVWDTTSGRVVAKFHNPRTFGWRPSWHPLENQILLASMQFLTRIYDVSEMSSVTLLRGRTDTARIYDMSNILPVQVLRGHTDKVRAAVWSPNGRYVMTVSADQTLRIWDIKELTLVQVMREHKGDVWTGAWSPDGQYAITGGDDKIIRLWEADTGQLVRRIKTRFGEVRKIAWSPNGRQVVFGGMYRSAYIWDVANDRLEQELAGHQDWIRTLAWSPDGTYIVTASADRTARIWNVATGQTVNVLAEHLGRISAVAWHPNGQQILTGGADGFIRIWDVRSGQILQMIEGRLGWIRGAAWSPNGQFIVAGGSNGVTHLWETSTNKLRQVLEGHLGSISSVGWSPDGEYLLTSSDDGTARISIVDIRLIIAEITRRVGNLLDEEVIRKEIPSWRGKEIELDAVKDYLAKYEAVHFGHRRQLEDPMFSRSFGERHQKLF